MTYAFPAYVPAIAGAVGLVALAVGVLLLMKRRLLVVGVVALFVGLLAAGLIAPMLALDRVVLDDEKLEQGTGFWWSRTTKGFAFKDVKMIRIINARTDQNREFELWLVYTKSGDVREIDPGDLWDMNTPDIVERLKAKGLDVRNET